MHYCPRFFEAIDTAATELKEHFLESDRLKSYGHPETVLSFTVDHDHAKQYPELSVADLELELAMFLRKRAITKVSDAIEIFQQTIPEVRKIFPQVELLLRLLLVCPASSTDAEKSFSSLRRLKTRDGELSEQCLCACDTHQELLDCIDRQGVLADFCSRSEVRQKLFRH